MKIEDYKPLTEDKTLCHELAEADVAGFHPVADLATAAGHCGLRSCLNDLSWWDRSIGWVASQLIAEIEAMGVETGFVAHDGITIWGFGTTREEAATNAAEYLGKPWPTDRPDCNIDKCGPNLWAVRDSLTDPSSGWSAGDVVELDKV